MDCGSRNPGGRRLTTSEALPGGQVLTPSGRFLVFPTRVCRAFMNCVFSLEQFSGFRTLRRYFVMADIRALVNLGVPSGNPWSLAM
jgi:hypothetical protein